MHPLINMIPSSRILQPFTTHVPVGTPPVIHHLLPLQSCCLLQFSPVVLQGFKLNAELSQATTAHTSPVISNGSLLSCAYFVSSKGSITRPGTGSTSKGAPYAGWPISWSHFTPHQVSHANCRTTCRSAHEVPNKAIPHGHALPSFPTLLTQVPTSPMDHYCYIPCHADHGRLDGWVSWILPALL